METETIAAQVLCNQLKNSIKQLLYYLADSNEQIGMILGTQLTMALSQRSQPVTVLVT